MQETQVPSLIREDLLEKEMATHPSILAWRISRTEEPGGIYTVHGVAKVANRTQRLNKNNPAYSSLPPPLPSIDLFGVSIVLPCPECQIVGITLLTF